MSNTRKVHQARIALSNAFSELKNLTNKLEHTEYWYAIRLERLSEWARMIPEKEQKEFFNILANGTASAYEPPSYAQKYNMLQYEISRLKAENTKLQRQVGKKSSNISQK